MINISSLVPSVEDLLKRSREELAYPMLLVIRSLRGIQLHRQNFLSTPSITSGYPPEYNSRVLEVLNEEWEWLRRKSYIGPQRDNPNSDFIEITRDGRKFLEDQEKGRASAGSPNGSPEASNADPGNVSKPLSRDLSRYLTEFPEWARRVIISRCAARVFPLFIPVDGRPREKAQEDIKAVDLSWKVAALAAREKYQAATVLRRLVEAVTDARNATTDEQNSSFDAAELAIAAARCSQQRQNGERSSPEDAVRQHELAFARFAEGKGGEYTTVSLRATRCLNDDLTSVERLVENPKSGVSTSLS